MNQPVELSIIIPTHNRRRLLSEGLAALASQTYPAAYFEVIVVADDCWDGTAEMVSAIARQAPYALYLHAHSARSAAATRNLGAGQARGRVLLFLDDDVVAKPGLVQAHMQLHAGGAEAGAGPVVLGYSRPVLPGKPSFWQYAARFWWEEAFHEMGRPGHRFSYRDFFSGNVSLPAALFHRAGGFDEALKVRLEDYELGLRLLLAGARFIFSPAAVGDHYENSDLELWLERVRKEGIATVQITRAHPELRVERVGRDYQANRPGQLRRNWYRSAALALPFMERPLVTLGTWLVQRFQWLRLRGLWLNLSSALSEYCFWRGVAAETGGRREFERWFQQAVTPPALSRDAPAADYPLPATEEQWQPLLEQARKSGLRVRLAGLEVLAFPPQAGLEPLRPEHITAALDQGLDEKFVPALALHRIRSALDDPS